MIAAPPNWTTHVGTHLMSLYPPGGGGRIRYYERMPLRPFSELIHTVLERDPDFLAHRVHAPREFVTCEGEYGAWIRINGVRNGGPATRFVGAVFVDDYAAAMDTLVSVRQKEATLESAAQELLVKARFGRGICDRRFRYHPPANWNGIPNGLVANWYPPDFPKNNTNIVVFPARRSETSGAEELATLIASEEARGNVLSNAVSETPIETTSGLTGSRWSFAMRVANRDHIHHREFVQFAEGPYSYTIRMESLSGDRIDEHRAIIVGVARSVEPIPSPGRRTIGPANPQSIINAFGHWLD